MGYSGGENNFQMLQLKLLEMRLNIQSKKIPNPNNPYTIPNIPNTIPNNRSLGQRGIICVN